MEKSMTATDLRREKPLPERLRICADMIQMGERIPFGRDQELMREAAETLEAVTNALSSLQRSIEAEGYSVMVRMDSPEQNVEKIPED